MRSSTDEPTPGTKAVPIAVGSKRQASLLGFTTSSSAEKLGAFDYEVFKGLLLQLFTNRALPWKLVDDKAFRALSIYLQPLLNDCIPSRRTLRRYVKSKYNQALTVVQSEIRHASTKIHLSFDLWTSLGRRLSLLGVVAHYLDEKFDPRAVLLLLPRMHGSHSATNLSTQLVSILDYFDLRESFGKAITDNASENAACLDLIGTELFIDTGKRHVRCMGHIVNLVA